MSKTESLDAAPKRKLARMGSHKLASVDMGAMGAFATLKAEADSIARAGVQHVLAAEDNLTPLLHNYLSGSVAKVHSDESGVAYETQNSEIYTEHGTKYADSQTGTIAWLADKENTLWVYIKIVDALKEGSPDTDGVPSFFLDSKHGQQTSQKPGGFQRLYPVINVPPAAASQAEQKRCIFAMSATQFVYVVGPPGDKLTKAVTAQVRRLYDEMTVVCKQVHVLFHWNAHSFFTYHQDSDGKVTAMVNLSHGKAEMHVAGQQMAVYDGIGSTHIFPSMVFHRSGAASRRCIKVAYFFDLEHPIDAEDEASSSGAKPPEAEVKVEVKEEANEEAKEEGGSSSTTV